MTAAIEAKVPVASRPPSARHGVRTARRIIVKIVTSVVVLLAAASVTYFSQFLVPGSRAATILNEQTGRTEQYTPA